MVDYLLAQGARSQISMINFGFWSDLPRPIVGLAPMDGVTDVVLRVLTKKIGAPDLLITEFVAVEGIARNAVALLHHLQYQPLERPIVAQVYGIEPDSFRTTATIVAAMGFDGIDINMGCPAKKVSRRGAGAALINNHELAAQIIAATKEGVAAWQNGMKLTDLPLKEKMIKAIEALAHPPITKKLLPVSVKTRIGYDRVQVSEWAAFLATQELAVTTWHGRTLKQLYSGSADWSAIGEAAQIIKAQSDTLVLGNGDIATRGEAIAQAAEFGLDGVLIGRAAVGNPWVFNDRQPSSKELIETIIEHANEYEATFGRERFPGFRRYLISYIKGQKDAAKLRAALMQAATAQSVATILHKSSAIVE